MDAFLHQLDWVLPLRHPALTPVAEFFTALGYTPFFLLSLTVLYWAWDKRATHRVAVLLMLSTLLNLFLKDLFQDSRPERYFLEGHREESFGLPSGHTQLALVFWFALAMEIGKRWFWIVASIFVAGIAFSRLYLGVHDVEDVLGGALLGVAGLLVYEAIRRFGHRIKHPQVAGVAGLIAGLSPLLFWPNQIPVPDVAILIAGFFLGWMGGVLLESKWCRFEKNADAPGKTILAVVLGLAGLAGLAAGLAFGLRPLVDAGFVPDSLAIGFGGAAAGLFITFLAPQGFVKAGWMTRAAAIR